MTVVSDETQDSATPEVASEADVSSYVSMLADEDLKTFAEKVAETDTPDKKDTVADEVKEPILDPITGKVKEAEPEAEKKDDKSTNKKEFAFNRKQYEDQGITDDKVLKILEERDKQIHHGQKTIGTQGRDLGQLRQMIVNLEAQKVSKDDINELSLTDHEKATESVMHNKDIDNKIQEVNQTLRKSQVQEIVFSRCTDFESKIDTIAEILIEDGIDKGIVNAFKNDPYQTDAPVLINLYKRAEQKNSISGLESNYKKQIADLTAENKRLKDNAKFVTTGIKNSGNRPTLDNLPSQGTAEAPKLSERDFALMSDEELAKL